MTVSDLFGYWLDPRCQALRAMRYERRSLVRFYCNFHTEYYKRHPSVHRLGKDLMSIDAARKEFRSVRERIAELDQRIESLKKQIRCQQTWPGKDR